MIVSRAGARRGSLEAAYFCIGSILPMGRTRNIQFGVAVLRSDISPDGRRILDAATIPQAIDAARDRKLCGTADITLEHFAVVADMLNDPCSPILGETQLLAVTSFESQQAPDVGPLRLQGVTEVGLGNAELLGVH